LLIFLILFWFQPLIYSSSLLNPISPQSNYYSSPTSLKYSLLIPFSLATLSTSTPLESPFLHAPSSSLRLATLFLFLNSTYFLTIISTHFLYPLCILPQQAQFLRVYLQAIQLPPRISSLCQLCPFAAMQSSSPSILYFPHDLQSLSSLLIIPRLNHRFSCSGNLFLQSILEYSLAN